MSNADDCRALVEKAGGCDILVNNAGIQFVAPIEEFPVEKWNAILAINLSSAFHTTAAALPGMRAKGWGRIVNIASAHGLTASPFKSAYVAAKHGAGRSVQDGGAGNRGAGHHLQRGLPRLCADPVGRGADPRSDEGPRHGPRDRDPRGDAATPAQPPVRHHRTDRRHRGLAVQPLSPIRSPAPRSASMAAGQRCDAAISLALQGGGAHGAFTWGVLDRLLEEDGIEIAAISGTSAGALNGAALKAGLLAGGRAAARKRLARLWDAGRRYRRFPHACPGCSPSCPRCGSGRRRPSSSGRSARRGRRRSSISPYAMGRQVGKPVGAGSFARWISTAVCADASPAPFRRRHQSCAPARCMCFPVRRCHARGADGLGLPARRPFRRSRSTARPIGTAAIPATRRSGRCMTGTCPMTS